MSVDSTRAAAVAVRDACLQAALDGYERAGLSGLCEEGRWEMVLDAISSLDVDAVLARTAAAAASAPAGGGTVPPTVDG
ncbi:MAG TPA: hypothetical protein VF292_16325 [Rhodanobacteraceae bacterium]